MASVRGICFSMLVMLMAVTTANSHPDCESASSCRDCIGRSVFCVWCSDPDYKGSRCMPSDRINPNCSSEDPRGQVVSLRNKPSGGMEQFSPIAAEFDLRVDEAQSFIVEVIPTANYPLDIYILMDLSFSMQPYLDNLRNLSVQLATTLSSITTDFRIGFGAFNEKPLVPFTISRMRPRAGLPNQTDYSFRHIVNLTDNITIFERGIANLATVSNNDQPEALLEGLLQATVCKEVVGWREETRRLIMVFTDQGYHIAGDGKLAGLVTLNDGECYVSRSADTGYYDYQMWGRFDYPSIGQVRLKLQENDIIPIFGSATDVERTYRNLVQEIPGAIYQSIGRRTEIPPELFLDIIRDSYTTTSQRIEILPSIGSEEIRFTITPNCPSVDQMNGSACSNVLIGQTATFNVSLMQASCSTREHEFNLRIPGFGVISLRTFGVCECPCESMMDTNSSLCTLRGDLTCGVCECHDERFGAQCQCDSPEAVNRLCGAGNRLNEQCSGRGRCQCGLCLCNPPSNVPGQVENATYFGEACECDNFSCFRDRNGSICSGRGECGCNQNCACEVSPASGQLFRGDGCQCPPVEEICINPLDSNETICSGHGQCPCDRCVCDDGFEEEYCNVTFMDIQSCDSSRGCVECEKNFASSETECPLLNCSTVLLIDAVNEDEYFINGFLANRCEFFDITNCFHVYYTIGSQGPIYAERTGCGGLPIPVWSIVLIVVGILVLFAIILLVVIKCTIIAMDYRELRTFEAERVKALSIFGQTDNPMYTNPNMKYENVMYDKELKTRSGRRIVTGNKMKL